MDALYIVTAYVVLDDSLKQQGFENDGRATLTAAEILTVAVVAARYFHNHLERALTVMVQLGYIGSLSVSRFNRRLHQLLGQLKRLNRAIAQRLQPAAVYLVDAFPLPVCQRVRQRACRKVQGEAFVGRCEAKREWFFGYKLHWCCSAAGVPLAFTLRPARRHEGSAMSVFVHAFPARNHRRRRCGLREPPPRGFLASAWHPSRRQALWSHVAQYAGRARTLASTPDD